MACSGCKGGGFELALSMAFQPIVDVENDAIHAYEALVRGREGQGARWVLDQVGPANMYAFDQRCRVQAIESAVAAGLLDTPSKLSINFLPNAVYSPLACIQLTLKTARVCGLPADRLIFEFTENEEMADPTHVANIIAAYRKMGFGTALDDFGAGHSGLALLARFQPHALKLDRELVRDIDVSLPRRMIVQGVKRMCDDMGIRVVAEGIERREEADALRAIGIRYMQGFYFARPALEQLPPVSFAAPRSTALAG